MSERYKILKRDGLNVVLNSDAARRLFMKFCEGPEEDRGDLRYDFVSESKFNWLLDHIKEVGPDFLYPIVSSGVRILVQHDWQALFDTTEFGSVLNSVRYPAEVSNFEFSLAGARVVYSIVSSPDGIGKSFRVFAFDRHGYLNLTDLAIAGDSWAKNITHAIARNAAAAMAILDSDVATRNDLPVNQKLNKARERRGRHKIPSISVIRLRPRSDGVLRHEGTAIHKSPRMHFCRGNWAHYADGRKIWRKWCFVGKPEDGIVEQQYVV